MAGSNWASNHWSLILSVWFWLTYCCLLLIQILMIRVIYEKVGGMLSSNERAELRIAEAFSAFSNINPLHYNPYTQPLWRAAVTQYDRMMAPAEQKVAGKLRNEIRGLESNSKQLIRKLETLGDLIRRPSISKELVMERWVSLNLSLGA